MHEQWKLRDTGGRVTCGKAIIVAVFGCLFILSGCVYNDEPAPKITYDYSLDDSLPRISAPVIKPSRGYGGFPKQWIPPLYLENKKRWEGIVIHHSGSSYGSAAHENKYHKSIGWEGLGYHFVINNGVRKNGYGNPDGLVEVGYRWRGQKTGSHCKVKGDRSNYWNKHTIGICLIGNFNKSWPTERQWQSLVKLIRFLQQRYNIPTSRIKSHSEIKPTDCPGKNFSFAELRRRSAQYE